MAKKRKTLPDDLQEMIDSGDMQKFAEVFDKCEINATDRGKTTRNVFSYHNLTIDHVRFLCEHGIDVNGDSGWGQTPAAFLADDMEMLKCLIEHGADIEHSITKNSGSALFYCAWTHRTGAVKNLLACGADPQPRGGWDNDTALDEALKRTHNIDTVKMAEIAVALLAAGAVISEKTKGYVEQIGRNFEFMRDNIAEDCVDELSEGLSRLYEIFDVPPVPRRVKYDGKTRITVKSKVWHEQQAELWEMLVPGSGHANTVQGEVIRITGRVAFELLDNGGINWDGEYVKMVKALPGYFRTADGDAAEKACEAAAKISSKSDKQEIYYLTKLAVEWVLANPDPIPLENVDYGR